MPLAVSRQDGRTDGRSILVGDNGVGVLQELPSLGHDPGLTGLLRAEVGGQMDLAGGGICADLDLHMAGTGLCGHSLGLNFKRHRPAALGAKVAGPQAAVGADLDGGDAVRPLGEGLVLQPRVDLLHHQPPYLCSRVVVSPDPLRGLRIAHPNGAGIVGRIAGEVAVKVVAGGTGLAGDGHTGENGSTAGAVGYRAAQYIVHQIGGRLLHRHVSIAGVVHHHGFIVVLPDLNDGPGLSIDAFVGKSAESGRHLLGGDAIGQASHSQRGQSVIGGIQIEAQIVLHEIEGGLRGQQLQYPCRHGVAGAAQTVIHSGVAVIGVVVVLRPTTGV